MVQPLFAGCAKDNSIEIIKRLGYRLLKMCNFYPETQWQDSIILIMSVSTICSTEPFGVRCVYLPNGTNMSVVLVRYTVSVAMLALGEKRSRAKPYIRKGWTDQTPMRRIGLIRHLYAFHVSSQKIEVVRIVSPTLSLTVCY